MGAGGEEGGEDGSEGCQKYATDNTVVAECIFECFNEI